MITISGQRLIGYQVQNISPLDRPLRTVFFFLPVIVFSWYSLQLLRNLNRGVTLAVPKSGLPLPKVFPGRAKVSKNFKLSHYDNSYLTGLLGLIFFAAAEFFLVIMFKSLDYTFLIN